MKEEDNYQFNYQKLLSFLSRNGQKGYVFARADDYTLIPSINKSLADDLSFKGIKTGVVYLSDNNDIPFIAQIEDASKGRNALIIANLFRIIDDDVQGHNALLQINFARETLWALNIPIVFWADAHSMNIIANQAPDLFSQRRHTTIHFTNTQTKPVAPRLKEDGLETFVSSEKFKETETAIAVLERRLHDAQDSNYPSNRIASEIALPLAKQYAQLNLIEDAKKLLKSYEAELDKNEDSVLSELARVYYLLHDYENSIKILQKANEIIGIRHLGNQGAIYPEQWFSNLWRIVDWAIEAGQPERFLVELMKADSMLERSPKTSNKLKRMTILIKNEIAEIMLITGRLHEARKYYEDGLSFAERFSGRVPFSDDWTRYISVSYNKLGNIEKTFGDLPKALKYFEDGLRIRESLYKRHPLSTFSQRDLSVSYDKLGDVEQALGDFQKARKYYEDGLRITQQLTRNNPLSAQFQRDLSVSYTKLGFIAYALGDLHKARNHYVESLKIIKHLRDSNPISEELQRDMSVCFVKLGDIEQTLEVPQKAREYFENSLAIAEQLCKRNPQSEQLQRDLAVCYAKLGDLESDHKLARKYFSRSLLIIQRLIKKTPLSLQLKHDKLYFKQKITEFQSRQKSDIS